MMLPYLRWLSISARYTAASFDWGRMSFSPGVISRGAQGGGAPLVKILDHFGGAQPPLEILALALLFKVY